MTMAMTMTRTKWFLPGFSVAIGLAILAAFWIGGEPWEGVWGLGVMSVLALGLLAFGRFDLVRGLRGDGRDEYWERIDIHATALAGLVTITLIIGMCLWEWAHGRSGTPYTQLGAIAGVAYVLALGLLRWRS
jgi:hypothetical protein